MPISINILQQDIITSAIALDELPQFTETETINIKKLILGALMTVMLLSLFGCGCNDTSGTPDADMGMNGDTAVTLPADDGMLDNGADDGIINDGVIDDGAVGDQSGDDVIDGDNYDTAQTDSAAGNSAGNSADNGTQENSVTQ